MDIILKYELFYDELNRIKFNEDLFEKHPEEIESLFVDEEEKHVNLRPNTWLTYSLSAFCQDNSDNCKNDFKELFARKAENGSIEECLAVKEELARSPDDEFFRERVEEVCRDATESQNDVVTSAFWWDESSPVGDYWQYAEPQACLGVVLRAWQGCQCHREGSGKREDLFRH